MALWWPLQLICRIRCERHLALAFFSATSRPILSPSIPYSRLISCSTGQRLMPPRSSISHLISARIARGHPIVKLVQLPSAFCQPMFAASLKMSSPIHSLSIARRAPARLVTQILSTIGQATSSSVVGIGRSDWWMHTCRKSTSQGPHHRRGESLPQLVRRSNRPRLASNHHSHPRRLQLHSNRNPLCTAIRLKNSEWPQDILLLR